MPAGQPRECRPKLSYSFVKIFTGSDLFRRRLPLMVARSPQPGPAVWLIGCIHGDEVGGTVVIQELFQRIRRELRCGSVWAFPLVNPIGFETASRHLTVSEEDLNRSFPGSPSGSLAERIAHIVFSQIAETRPAVVFDLHNDVPRSISYAVLDPQTATGDDAVYQRVVSLATCTGLPVVQDEVMRRTLSHSLLSSGIAAITLELGESLVVNEVNVADGVTRIWRAFAELGMVEPIDLEQALPESAGVLHYSDQPLASTSGIVRYLVKPGEWVRPGQPVAIVYNAFGRKVETLCVADGGLVLGHSDTSVSFPGMAAMAIGIDRSRNSTP